MVEPIDPIDLRLAQLLGKEDLLAQAPAPPPATAERAELKGNPFEDLLSRAIQALEGVSKAEIYTNELIDKYIRGEVGLQEVMLAQSKMSLLVQLAVTTINTAVTTFKEITQMQI